MSFLFPEKRQFATPVPERRAWATTKAGVDVTHDEAHRHSATWGCLAAIAEAIQSLDIEEHRSRLVPTPDDPGRRLTTQHDVPSWLSSPSPDHTWEDWIWEQSWQLAARGRIYAWIASTDYRGNPTSLVPLDDDLVSWRYSYQTHRWITSVNGQDVERWPLGPLWHCPLYTTSKDPRGMSPIAYHAETIGVGLAAQAFGAQFFGDGGHPTHMIKTRRDLGPEKATTLKERFKEITLGSREPIVVPADTEIERLQVNPDESQFLNTMRYSGEDVCRIFGVPPSKIHVAISGQSVTYTNTASANTDWRSSGLSRYVRRLEAHLSRLLPGGENRKIKFDFTGFLRADLPARMAAYKTATEIGQMAGTPLITVNEMRQDEGRHALPGGDDFDRIVQTPTPATTIGGSDATNADDNEDDPTAGADT